MNAVVEELMLEAPWSFMDQRNLKKQVAAVMSSGREFESTATWQVGA